jgi:mono/diheme cytochrome c family protein
MADGQSDGRGANPEHSSASAAGPIAEARSAASAAHVVVAPARAATPKRSAVAVFKGLANVLFMALVIYVTYFFTMFFSTRPPVPAPVPESARVAAKKIEELRAEERKILTTYGPVNPATKAVRIPVDRAMELMVAESAQPAPTPASPPGPSLAPAPAAPNATEAMTALKGETPPETPKAAATTAAPETIATIPVPPTVPAVAPTPAPAPVGMAPAQLYRAICMACHDADGRGAIVRKAMPTIPDLSDPKWQATRTDAELQHSMLEGKGQFMLPMKDKFALAHTDPKDMVAFMRSFQPGRPAVATGTSSLSASAPSTSASVVVGAPSTTAERSTSTPALTAPPAPASALAPSTAPSASPAAAALALASTSPIPDLFSNLNPTPGPSSLPASPSATGAAPTLSFSPTKPPAPSPERMKKLRAAGEFYNINCLACHGQDGRGSIVRPAMPVIPDFTSRDWHTTHANPQLAISILDGKGMLMPPWRGRVDPALAQDLVAFIRGFAPADLASASTPTTGFGTRMRQLQQQWQEFERQARALSGP